MRGEQTVEEMSKYNKMMEDHLPTYLPTYLDKDD